MQKQKANPKWEATSKKEYLGIKQIENTEATRPVEERIRKLYNRYGQSKPLSGSRQKNTKKPYFFLHRTFLREQDLVIIFNTKRCRYNCYFCSLPSVCSPFFVSGDDILAQFEYVVNEVKHSLGVLNRITISNNGSVLDEGTMPAHSLFRIARCVREIRRIRTIVLESKLEFISHRTIDKIKEADQRSKLSILTGFETLNRHIRDEVLGKREPLETFEAGLNKVAESGVDLTAFVLYKPSPTMEDSAAYAEANSSIEYLVRQCDKRNIDLTVRLNPMYAAKNSKWASIALATLDYKPPRLTDVLQLAIAKSNEGIPIYVGLSTEGLDLERGSYRYREDYSAELLKKVILFNSGKLP